MQYKCDVMFALGGTNIYERMDLVIEGCNNDETPVVGFLGAWQGTKAIKYFEEHGIPKYSREAGRGYVVLRGLKKYRGEKNPYDKDDPEGDSTRTTLESAIVARAVVDKLSLGSRVCICTESYHAKGALEDFRIMFPSPEYTLEARTVDVPMEKIESFIRSYLHEVIRKLFEIFYKDLPRADTSDDIRNIWHRELAMQKAVHNPLRDRIESPLFEIAERSKNTGIYRLITRLFG